MNQQVTWLLLPLLIAISLVYNGTRFEQPKRILIRSGKWTGCLCVAFGAAFLLLYVLG